jgi:hypothetical protein
VQRDGAEAAVETREDLGREDVEQALDLLFGANRPTATHGDTFRREVREAFRRRALDTHPDRAQALGRSEASLAEDFRHILEAYQILSREEAAPSPRPVAQRPRERASRPPQDHLHRAPLPHRPLLFAEFLYYSGRASWRNLVEAVAWQRRQRPAIGRIAVEWGHLSDEEVREILDQRRREGSAAEPFGEYARKRGFLSATQLLALLGRQRRLQRRIGQFFVETGIVADAEISSLEQDLSRHNARWRRTA